MANSSNAELASVRPLLRSVFNLALEIAGPDSWRDVSRAATVAGKTVAARVGEYGSRFRNDETILEARIHATAEGLKRLLEQQVQAMVFCDSPETADRVFNALKQTLSHRVARQGKRRKCRG